MVNKFPLAVVQLCANVVQPAGVDAVRLAVNGFDELLGPEFFEDGECAVAEQHPFAGVALNVGDATGSVATMDNASALGEDVQGALFLSGNIHTGNACNQHVQKRANTRRCVRKV